MKKVLTLLLAASMTVGMLTGCGASTVPSPGSAAPSTGSGSESVSSDAGKPASGKPVTISWWGTQAVHEFTLELCGKFTEKTGVALEPVYASWGDYWQKMNTLAAAGDLPDIMRQDYGVIQQYASKGLLEPLDSYIESGVINAKDIESMLLDGGKIDGKIYGLSVGSNAKCLLYDKEMIEEAGFTVPDVNTTWEDFEKFCIEFSKKTGKTGVGLKSMLGLDIFEIYARGKNQQVYSTEDVPTIVVTQELLVEYLDSVKRMHDAGAVQKIDTVAQETSGEDSAFAKGEAASDFSFTDMYATFAGVKGKPLGITIQPGAGANKAMYAKPSQFLSISASSDQKDEAARFIDAWTNDSDLNAILKGRRGVPISTAIAGQVASTLDEAGKATFGYMTLLNDYSSPIAPPSPSGATEVNDEFKKQMEMLLFGEATSAEAAAEFITNANNILATANK